MPALPGAASATAYSAGTATAVTMFARAAVLAGRTIRRARTPSGENSCATKKQENSHRNEGE
jgi:ABC-type nickel/cobalt efflux system permease component RcnA